MVKEGKIRTSLSLKVTTNKLLEYNISFSESINDILTSILCQQNLIKVFKYINSKIDINTKNLYFDLKYFNFYFFFYFKYFLLHKNIVC